MKARRFKFDFAEQVPLLTAEVNGTRLDRFLLDTGASSSCLHKEAAARLGLRPSSANTVHVDCLRFGEWDLGPIDLRVSSFGENRLDGLLGTRELASYRVTLDLDRSISIIDCGLTGDAPFTKLELFRGRPVLHVEHEDVTLTFVLDTGSGANWLFAPGQDNLATIGTVVDHSDTAKSTRGNLAVRRAKVVHNMSLGGRNHAEVSFLLPEAGAWFGGPDAVEDGILGVGALASAGRVVMDFPGGKFLLVGGAGQPLRR